MRILAFIFAIHAAGARAAEIPIHVQYVRAGTENPEAAELLGKAEIENGNPCVSKMRKELAVFARSQEMSQAVATVVGPAAKIEKVEPHLVLRYLNESMELRFEIRRPAVKEEGRVVVPERVLSRKGVLLTTRPGSWKERMDNDQCRITEKMFIALTDTIRESERLKACKARKVELLDASQKVSNYIHNYMPVNWIDEARRKLAEQRYEVTGVLRADSAVYREGNETYRECAKGLKLLEDEAAASVRVLNEVKAAKRGTELPVKALEDLERKLTNSAQ
jgi:hypothetical protein